LINGSWLLFFESLLYLVDAYHKSLYSNNKYGEIGVVKTCQLSMATLIFCKYVNMYDIIVVVLAWLGFTTVLGMRLLSLSLMLQ